MIPFPADQIHDEDAALDWWENQFAPCCAALGGQGAGALLVRELVSSLRTIRNASLDELLTVARAASDTGYPARQIRRWGKDGKNRSLGTDTARRGRRGDVTSHKKCS